MSRIAIFGGTFNPPHRGHVEAARACVEQLVLDRLLLVPAGLPPHKALPQNTPSPVHRLRIQSALRRARRQQRGVFCFKDVSIDMQARRVWRAGQEIALTPREYALLETLVLNRNIALTRGQLLADAWGYDYVGESRTVDVHINRVRRKLGLSREIQTVFKVGYRLNTRGLL